MSDMQNIQWFPGHMTKTRRQIQDKLPLIDIVAEIIDARRPASSRNPELAGIVANKPRIILLNKCDMADEAVTAAWVKALGNEATAVIPVDCKTGKGLDKFISTVKVTLKERLANLERKRMGGRTLRVMVVGIPNVGKSSFINRMAKSGGAKVENRPGVTRGNQWFTIERGIEMLDTPGVLWPKFDDQIVGERLAFTGAVKDNVVDIEGLAVRLLEFLAEHYSSLLVERYKLENLESFKPHDLLAEIGRKRSLLIAGGGIDTERTAHMLLEEFRNSKIGRISLEKPKVR